VSSDRPLPLPEAGKREAPKRHCHKGTQRTQKKNLLSLCPSCPPKPARLAGGGGCGQFMPGFPRPLFPFPLQNVKEQAPERLTYATLPRFDGNATAIIQLFSATTGFAAFLTAFARAEGAESAEKEMGICDATCCGTLAFNFLLKGNRSSLCALRASARACLSSFFGREGKEIARQTPPVQAPLAPHPLDKTMGEPL
jgi:hypothetical protein